jgi:hypothetical protein
LAEQTHKQRATSRVEGKKTNFLKLFLGSQLSQMHDEKAAVVDNLGRMRLSRVRVDE